MTVLICEMPFMGEKVKIFTEEQARCYRLKQL